MRTILLAAALCVAASSAIAEDVWCRPGTCPGDFIGETMKSTSVVSADKCYRYTEGDTFSGEIPCPPTAHENDTSRLDHIEGLLFEMCERTARFSGCRYFQKPKP
jgi:hypothetical protein